MRLFCQKHAILCTLEHSTGILTLKRYLQTQYITLARYLVYDLKCKQTLSYNISHEIICHNTLNFKTNEYRTSIIYAKVQFMPLRLLLLNCGIPLNILSNLIQQKWRNAPEGENCISYLMNCTMNFFIEGNQLKLLWGIVGCLVRFKR